jgi:hypothetical protein
VGLRRGCFLLVAFYPIDGEVVTSFATNNFIARSQMIAGLGAANNQESWLCILTQIIGLSLNQGPVMGPWLRV